MKKVLITLLVITSFLLVGCSSKENKPTKKKETVSTIEIGKKNYIEQLKEITIKDTKDTVKITEEVKWEVPETEGSFTIAVPYTIKVDGKEYEGIYYLGDNETDKDIDKNPKYNFKITDLTKEGKTEILITEK